MDDRFLQELRRDPDPEFARELRSRLRAIEADEAPRGGMRPWPWLAAAAAAAIVVALSLSPGLRLQAQALLDLFRVRDFAVVQVDEAHARQWRERDVDPAVLFVRDPGSTLDATPPRAFATLAEAAAAAGFSPLQPGILPRGLAPDSAFVHGGGRTTGRIDTRALRELMDAFDVRDLRVPQGLEGQAFTVEMPAMLGERFRSGGRAHAVLIQCASPVVSTPRGVDLASLGEIGLRLVGLPRAEAHRLAGAIDWRTTLVVPVLANATSFQQVEVGGDRGVCIENTSPAAPDAGRHGGGTAVLWTHGGRVLALSGNLGRIDLMQMAGSVR